jgi:hypothetical protein
MSVAGHVYKGLGYLLAALNFFGPKPKRSKPGPTALEKARDRMHKKAKERLRK